MWIFYMFLSIMKLIKLFLILLFIWLLVWGFFFFKWNWKKIVDIKKTNDTVNSIVNSIKWVTTWSIQSDLSWTIDDVKWYAQQYYNDVLSGYVNRAKQDLSWKVADLKWQYNQWVDDIWDMISNTLNSAITEELNKLKLK